MTAGFAPLSARVWTLGDPDAPALSFNGVDADGVRWVINDPKGWYSTPPIELGLEDRPTDGAWYGRGAYKPRVVEISGAFRACTGDPDVLDAAAERLVDAVGDPRTSTLLAVTEKIPKQLTVRPSDQVYCDAVRGHPRARTFSFVLTAADPFKYAAGGAGLVTVPIVLVNPATVGGASHPMEHPLDHGDGAVAVGNVGQASVVNAGKLPVFPTITLVGPLPSPTITNVTTGEAFTLAYSLAAGETAVIDMELRTVLLSGISRLSLKGPRSKFFALAQGVNDLRFTATSYAAGTAAVAYRPRWK